MNCPCKDELINYLSGELNLEDIEQIAAHITSCSKCELQLEHLDKQMGNFSVGSDVTPIPFASEPECQFAMQRAQDLSKCIHDVNDSSKNSNGPKRESGLPFQIGRFQIVKQIANGGMGTVYEARDNKLNRDVALKTLSSNRSMSESAVLRFRDEASTTARLEHPNIVPIHDIGEYEGVQYFTMKLIDGATLADKLDDYFEQPRRAVRIITTIAAAVHFAHQHGVLHRDLKPSNILVDKGGEPHVSDFGLAKRLDVNTEVTQSGVILGTPSYMAPEQASAGKVPTTATDVYGLGAILYALLTGRPPFQGDTPMEICRQVIDDAPVPPHFLNSRIDRDLETICLKCLEKQPNTRYGSARALVDDLHRWQAGETILARRPPRWERFWRYYRRHPAFSTLSIICLILTMLIVIGSPLAAFWWRQERDDALSARTQARQNEKEATLRLFDSYLDQARAGQWSRRPGQRLVGIENLKKAAKLLPELDLHEDQNLRLRNQMIACMSLIDLKLNVTYSMPVDEPAIDSQLKRYAFGDSDGSIACFRFADGQKLFELPGFGAESIPQSFSPDGKLMSVFYRRNADGKCCLRVWDLDNRAVIIERFRPRFGKMVFSPDGRLLAVSDSNGVDIFHMQDIGRTTRILTANIDSLPCFHANGKRIMLVDGPTNSIKVYKVESGDHIDTYRISAPPSYLASHDQGNLIAAGCKTGQIYVLDSRNGKTIAELVGHVSHVSRIAIDSTGKLIISRSWDGTTRIWHAYSGVNLLRIEGHLRRISTDGKRVAIARISSGEFHTCIYDVILPSEFIPLNIKRQSVAQPWDVSTDSKGELVACADVQGIGLWNLANGSLTDHFSLKNAFAVKFSKDKSALIAAGQDGVALLKMEVGDQSNRFEGNVEKLTGALSPRLTNLTLSRDGRFLATTAHDGNALLLDRHQNSSRFFDAAGAAFSLALSPDAKWLATTFLVQDSKLSVRIWEQATGDHVCDLPVRAGRIRVKFSPNGNGLITSTPRDYTFWSTNSWEPKKSFTRSGRGLAGPFAFTDDGELMAVAASRYVTKILRTETLRELATLESPEPRPSITAFSFTPLGEKLVVAGQNGTLHVWNLQNIRKQLNSISLDWNDSIDH